MKHLPLFALTLLLFGCSKPDDPYSMSKAQPSWGSQASGTNALDPSLVGTWKVDLSKTTISIPSDSIKQMAKAMTYELRADGTMTIHSEHRDESGTWMSTGKEVVLRSEDAAAAPVEFEISANKTELSMSQADSNNKTVVLILTRV